MQNLKIIIVVINFSLKSVSLFVKLLRFCIGAVKKVRLSSMAKLVFIRTFNLIQ